MERITYKRIYSVDLIFTNEIFNLLSELSTEEAFCITDKNLFKIYVENLKKIFNEKIFKIEPGEESKNINTTMEIFSFLCKLKASRNSIILGFGGGVVEDITGFVSGIYKRGINFSLIPTSLLSFVDSSIGGKTGINTECGKNYMGLFNHPEKIIFDFNLLKTLPKREFQNGLFELLKYGFVLDEEIYNKFKEDNFRKNLNELVKKAIFLKSDIVTKDERESGLRSVLNFGHTFGHALEKVTMYKKFSHGEAVGLGIIFALILGKNLKLTPSSYCNEGIEIVKKIKALSLKEKIKWEEILKAMFFDKKIKNLNSIFFVISNKPGSFIFKEIDDFKILEKTYLEFLKSL